MSCDEFRGKFADMLFPSIILFSSLLAGTTAQAPEARIAAALQQVADHVAAKFNCSIAMSYFLPGASGIPSANVSVAAGFTDSPSCLRRQPSFSSSTLESSRTPTL